MGELDDAVQDAKYWRREFLQTCNGYEELRGSVRASVEAHATRFASDENRGPLIRQAGTDVLAELQRFDATSISLQSSVGAAAVAAEQAAAGEFLERFAELLNAAAEPGSGSTDADGAFVTARAQAVADLFETATVLVAVHCELVTEFKANSVGVNLARVFDAAIDDLNDRGWEAVLDLLKEVGGPLVPILNIVLAVRKVLARAEELVYREPGPEDALSFFGTDLRDLNLMIETFIHDLDAQGTATTPWATQRDDDREAGGV